MITLEELYKRELDSKNKGGVRSKKKKKTSKQPVEDEEKQEVKVDEAQEDISEDIKEAQHDFWRPYEIQDFILPEFKIPVKKSHNYESYKRKELSRVLTFIDYVKRIRYKTGCTAIPIPTTSRRNLMIWGYEMAITRAIKFMIEIGLISIYDDKYRFGVPFEGANFGKTYAYYKDNEDKLIQYCKDNNIHKYVVKNVEIIDTEEQVEAINNINEVKEFDVSQVRFGRDLEIEKPDRISRQEFQMYLTQCLYQNYPELQFHQIKVDEMNENFYEDYPEFKLRFRPRYTWKGNKVVRVGIRLTNEYCCKKREERKELLRQYGFHLEKDVRSSVPRLTLSINKGHWVDEDIDIYKLINDEFDPGSEFTEARREAMKHYILTTYFEERSDKMLGKNVTYKIDQEGLVKTEVDDLMGRLRRATIQAVGGRTLGSEIFYVESCVYLMAAYDLLTSGHMVWVVYDAFYSNGEEDQDTFENMLRSGIKMNFKWFLERSNFRQYSEGAIVEENQSNEKLSMEDISKKLSEKYNIKIIKGEGVL